MWKLTKEYWKDMWNLLGSNNNKDENAIERLAEKQKGYKRTATKM